MATNDEAPDLESLEAQLRSDWAGRDLLIEEMRALRWMEVEPDVPTAYEAEKIRAPVAQQIVTRVVGAMTTDEPMITVPPARQAPEAMGDASKVERATIAILAELQRQNDSDVLERFLECLIADGHGCMRMFHVPQIWKGYPKRDKKADESDSGYNHRTEDWKRGKSIPISWTWVDPLTVYPMWSDLGLERILEVGDRSPVTLHPKQQRWNNMKDNPEIWELLRGEKSASIGSVKFSQLWTKTHLTYAVNGKVVHHQKHRYKRPPYVYAYGLSPSTTERKHSGLSILYPLRHILPYFDRLLSQMATAVRIWCWPTPVIHTKNIAALINSIAGADTVKESGIPRTIEITPGEPVTLYEDEEIGFLVWKGNSPELSKMLAIVQEMIQKAGLADVMYGQSASGDSGYLVNQLIAAARMKLKPITVHGGRAMERMIQVLWDIVEYQIKEPLHVYNMAKNAHSWLVLKPKDLNGYRQVRVTINPMLPTDLYATSSRAINEVGAGLRGIGGSEGAMEMIGINQPDQMENQILWEKMKQMPVVQNLLAEEVARLFGIELRAKSDAAQSMTEEEIRAAMPGWPPGMQQALSAQAMAGAQGGSAVMAGPGGVQAAPPPPTPQAGAALPRQGLQQRPEGIATGQAPGARRTGEERA